MLNLKDSIAKAGYDDFIALVRRDGADTMIKYGAEALQKAGKADSDKAASLLQPSFSFQATGKVEARSRFWRYHFVEGR